MIAMRSLNRYAITFLGAFVALVCVTGAWLAWQLICDPLAALPRQPSSLRVISEEQFDHAGSSEMRQYRKLVFASTEGERIQITVSLPAHVPARPMPVLILLGGLRTGQNSVKNVPQPGDNVIIGYEYPIEKKIDHSPAILWKAKALRRAVLQIPGQVTAIIRWARSQPWTDPERISVLGFSLGALFLPAVHRLARDQNLPLGPAIMAYGGADIAGLLSYHLKEGPQWSRDLIAALVAAVLRPVEPALHLPHLRGEFLLISGANDSLVPEASAHLMQQLTPQPNTVIRLEGGHIDGRKSELAQRIVAISRDWLLQRGAINP